MKSFTGDRRVNNSVLGPSRESGETKTYGTWVGVQNDHDRGLSRT